MFVLVFRPTTNTIINDKKGSENGQSWQLKMIFGKNLQKSDELCHNEDNEIQRTNKGEGKS